jgi:peptide/nickel transport system permease protein
MANLEIGAAPPLEAAPDATKKKGKQGYWDLVWWKFKRNRLGVVGGILVLVFYITCFFFPEFFAPYAASTESRYLEAPPQVIRFVDDDGNFGLQPFVYGMTSEMDMMTRTRTWVPDPDHKIYLHFFVRGEDYRLLGLIPMNIHFVGTDPNDPDTYLHLFGTDRLGRDLFSRIIHGGRITLTIGLVGVILSLVFGTTLGAISGYYGGAIDNIIQRFTEFLSAFPGLPLIMALTAALPVTMTGTTRFFMITVILAFIAWGGLARQVRGIVLSLREREYVMAAKSFGASDRRLIFKHLIPGTMSHVIVISTLAIPAMVLTEAALSFLGLGLVPPTVSWGVLLNDVNTIRAIRFAPWLLLTVPFIITCVLAFNMLGDGLRDAMDPYGGR